MQRFRRRPFEPASRRLTPPVVVTALLWVGLQVLVLLYLRSVLGPGIAKGDPDAALLLDLLAVAPRGALPARWWLSGTSLLLVVLLWLKYRSVRWPGRGDRVLGAAVYGGVAALVLLTHLAWETLLRTDIPWTLERLP